MNNQESTVNKDNQEWPDELDALIAAPEHHQLILENERVRVLNTRIPPGETTPVHTHRWSSVFHIMRWSDFVRYDDEGNVLVDTRQNDGVPAAILWADPLPPHSLENVGDVDIHLISVELKD